MKKLRLLGMVCLLVSSFSVNAALLTVDFDDVTLSGPYTFNVDTISHEFLFSTLDNTRKGVISDPENACDPGCASNGTNYLYGQTGYYYMTSLAGNAFNLTQFDVAELQPGNSLNLTSIQVIGAYKNGGTVTQTFVLDGIIDGIGGLSDFQTASMSNTFIGLSSVTLIPDSDYFALDNFVIDVAEIPMPAAIWLFGSGLLGLVGMARRKLSM